MQQSVLKIVLAGEKKCPNFHCSMQKFAQIFIVACNKVPKFSLQHAKKCPSFHCSIVVSSVPMSFIIFQSKKKLDKSCDNVINKMLLKSHLNFFLAQDLRQRPQNFFVTCNKVLRIFPDFFLALQQSPSKFFLVSKRNCDLRQCDKG